MRLVLGRSLFLSFIALYIGLGTHSNLRAGQAPSSGFHIDILDGEGALNNVKGRIAREPIVQVEDENHKPVSGATVIFDLPANGAGGQFANGTTSFTAVTDASGRAVAHGLQNNGVAGQYSIHVRVTYQGRTIGTTDIHQTNVSNQVAHLSKGLDHNQVGSMPDATPLAQAGIVGIAAAAGNFLINGTSSSGTANLAAGTHVQTLGNPMELFLQGGCQVGIAPGSTVTTGPSQISLEKGALRAQQLGKCNLVSNGMRILANQETTEVIVRVSGSKVDVAAIGGNVQIVGAQNAVIGTVPAGTASAFSMGAALGASAASAATVSVAEMMALGAAIAGAGVAVGAVAVASSSTSP